jgi:hypothetical protein
VSLRLTDVPVFWLPFRLAEEALPRFVPFDEDGFFFLAVVAKNASLLKYVITPLHSQSGPSALLAHDAAVCQWQTFFVRMEKKTRFLFHPSSNMC